MKIGYFKQLAAMFGLLVMTANPAVAGCFDDRAPGMDWSGCKKTNKILDDSNFSGSRFDDAILAMSSLDDSNFKGASLVKADMTRASARRAAAPVSSTNAAKTSAEEYTRTSCV